MNTQPIKLKQKKIEVRQAHNLQQNNQSYKSVVKQFGRMYEGMQNYNQQKQQLQLSRINDRKSKILKKAQRYSRYSKSAHYSQKHLNQTQSRNILPSKHTFNSPVRKQSYDNRNSIHHKAAQLFLRNGNSKLKMLWSKSKHKNLKEEVNKLERDAQTKYGLKFHVWEQKKVHQSQFLDIADITAGQQPKLEKRSRESMYQQSKIRGQSFQIDLCNQSIPHKLLVPSKSGNCNTNLVAIGSTVRLKKKTKNILYFRI